MFRRYKALHTPSCQPPFLELDKHNNNSNKTMIKTGNPLFQYQSSFLESPSLPFGLVCAPAIEPTIQQFAPLFSSLVKPLPSYCPMSGPVRYIATDIPSCPFLGLPRGSILAQCTHCTGELEMKPTVSFHCPGNLSPWQTSICLFRFCSHLSHVSYFASKQI